MFTTERNVMTKVLLNYMGYGKDTRIEEVIGVSWINKMATYYARFNYLSDRQKEITAKIIEEKTGIVLSIAPVKPVITETITRTATVKNKLGKIYKDIPHTTTHELPFSTAQVKIMPYNENYVVLDTGDRYYKIPRPVTYTSNEITKATIMIRKTKHKGFMTIK